MAKRSADYLVEAKCALGNPHMTDRELGERLGGFSQPSIGKVRLGNMSDPLALALASVLPDVEAGEILMVARAEREKDANVKAAMLAYVGKILSVAPSKAAARSALGGVAVAVALSAGAPSPSQASTLAHAQGERVCIM